MEKNNGPRQRAGRSCARVMVFMVSAFLSASEVRGEASRSWRNVPIRGAKCGDGQPYSVFISAGDPRKIAFDLMGGGACWSAASCLGPVTWIHPIPSVLEKGGFVSSDPTRSPVSGHTLVFFPYCTGDVHLGDHVAQYGPWMKMHHYGDRNFKLAVEQLVVSRQVDFADAKQFVLMGYSAGALGALSQVLNIEPYVRTVPDKVLIADSPGLHFGESFWDKFPPALIKDFTTTLARVGLRVGSNRGNLAATVPQLCRMLPDWRIGVLQGSRDEVMSHVFGAISPEAHEAMIFGPEGLYALTEDPSDNCSAWVPTTRMHTFLVTDESAAIRTESGKSAMGFVKDLVQSQRGSHFPNYR